MNAPTLTMPQEEAKQRLEEYRASRHHAANAEYRRIAEAYAALAKGTPLLQLSEAFKLAPRDDKGRPRLAIARADAEEVRLRQWAGAGRYEFGISHNTVYRRIRAHIHVALPPVAADLVGFALVPIIPPAAKAAAKGLKPKEVFVLWEVEAWASSSSLTRPDRDPFLLKRLDDDLYAVLAEWDLTEVERAILAGRTSRLVTTSA